ncbi:MULTISPECIES: GNAT family N-acetyltransferase [Paenibacillus]|uniref:GNAT family N-acetyltransferase n=1 Tax=Paenibacillus TaxID=44249 RepID=UPI001FFE5746|nr:GNAT family N-acetyltransferase [Paenibacillus pabuli]UPK45614.1 GNAT family N-acetyltransferase [Paenibacillus pabuli]
MLNEERRYAMQKPGNKSDGAAMIRTFVQNDLQYVIEAHIRIYRDEYNYDQSFADFIKKAVNDFERTGNYEREMVWIIELNGTVSGCIGLTQLDEYTAQLRWFIIEPEARNAGLGRQLIEQAIHFARDKSYSSIILWTNESLSGARRLYQSFGFEVVEIRKQILSGQELTEEKWEMILGQVQEEFHDS